MTTNAEILKVVTSQNSEVKKIGEALIGHIAAQDAQDKKLNTVYAWAFEGNGESGKSQITQNSKFRKVAGRLGTALALIFLGESVAIAFLALRQYLSS